MVITEKLYFKKGQGTNLGVYDYTVSNLRNVLTFGVRKYMYAETCLFSEMWLSLTAATETTSFA